MRALMAAGALLLALAGPAAAQTANYAGTWAFQTEPYGDERFGVIMSGAAVMTAAARGRYDIRLIANELIIDHQSGQSRMLTARQNCTGELAGAQLNVTCQLAAPIEGYEPDNFVLQQGQDADELVGVLASAASSEVTFARLR